MTTIPKNSQIDVTTIGRASVDLYGAQIGGRLEDMGSFHKYIGGSPANMAVGTARLGLRSALISRVGDEHMGRFIREELVREGVDVQGLVTDPDRLTALVLLGIRDEERFPLIFYRENCADMALCEADIDAALIERSRSVVATGTHLSHPRTEAAVLKALDLARRHGARCALDIDYRPNLWGLAGHGDGESRYVQSAQVTSRLQASLHLFDLIVGTEEEFHIAGGSTDTLAALRAVRALTGAVLVCKRGAAGAVAFDGAIPGSLEGGQLGPGFAVEVFNVLGAGDGFMSGLLKGWLDDAPWPEALKYANACGAFAVSRHGCAPAYPSLEELQLFLRRGLVTPALRLDSALEQIHWSTNRRRTWTQMRAFAFDHRAQLEDLPGATPPKIAEFKAICLQAALQVANGRPGYGILCDQRLGKSALHAAAGQGLWIGRPVEWPGARPLTLEPELGPDFGGLAEWPLEHVVKVLCYCHPDDEPQMQAEQEATLTRLFHACRRNRLELLLELIPSKVGPSDDQTTARLIERFYDIGIYPDWWKLEPMRSHEAWAAACDAIKARDPHVQGIVILGLGQSEQELAEAFQLAAPFALVKGFAVGRTIHGQAGKDFLAQRIDSATALATMAAGFDRLCRLWDQARRKEGDDMTKLRLTAAQAMAKWLSVQLCEDGNRYIEGVWAIFGHGNVVGLGEALYAHRDVLPTWRGHNEQTMAHTAIAFAKASKRRRAMAVTSSIGPGATNMVTAAALAHANRLPVLFIPGDVFASRAPDPVLQQIEDFGDGTVSANDCFRPVSRYFDRIMRPEQLLTALPRAIRVMTDPAECGPVTLAFCQDVQAEAFDYPESFFAPRVWKIRRPAPDAGELAEAAKLLKSAKHPVIVAGGGAIYAGAEQELASFALRHGLPVVETQAGKSALAHDHPMNFGPVGVTGSTAANVLCAKADVVLAIGTRLQDFTTGSWSIFKAPGMRLISANVQAYDAFKHGSLNLTSDAKIALQGLDVALGDSKWNPDSSLKASWQDMVAAEKSAPNAPGVLPTDGQVIGAVQRTALPRTVVMGAAGSMPGELHKIWDAPQGGYHMEYGFSCMGYEIAGALGIKMARPEADVICMLGDGSYMMANSELASAVMMGIPFTVVLTDNRGFGCINRLQKGTGGAGFNNLLDESHHVNPSHIDFVAHAASMGAHAVKAGSIAELEQALIRAKSAERPFVIVIDSDPWHTTKAGGSWWQVGVPEVSERAQVRQARADFAEARKSQVLAG